MLTHTYTTPVGRPEGVTRRSQRGRRCSKEARHQHWRHRRSAREPAGSEGPCCSNQRQPRPSPTKEAIVAACCSGRAVCSCSSQQTDEAGSFSTPAFANLDAKNDQAALRRPPELRIRAFLVAAGICKGCAGSGPTAAAGCPSRS